jgi:hypothetical protein
VAVDWAVAKAQYGGLAAADAAAEAAAAAAAAAEQEQRRDELMGGLESDSEEEGDGAKLVSALLGMAWHVGCKSAIGTACLPDTSAMLPCGSFLLCLHLARLLTACLSPACPCACLPVRVCTPLSGPRGG